MLSFSFLLTCLLIELTPGPNMTYLAILSSQQGRRAGFSMVLGVATGLCCIGVASLMGAAAAIMESPVLYHALHWSGVAYLCWLAFDIARGGDITLPHGDGLIDARFFRRGFVTNLLNPKAAVFFVTVFSSYLDPLQPALPQSVLLLGVYLIIATTIHSLIVLLGDRARPYLMDSPQARRIRLLFAMLLVGMALWFAIGLAA